MFLIKQEQLNSEENSAKQKLPPQYTRTHTHTFTHKHTEKKEKKSGQLGLVKIEIIKLCCIESG